MHEETVCLEDEPLHEIERGQRVWALGEVLAELLAQFVARYPELKLVVVDSPAPAPP